MQKIAPILGLNAVEKAPRIAVIRCNGSCENRRKPAITKAHTAARSFPRFIPARVIVIMGVLAKEIVRQLANSEYHDGSRHPTSPYRFQHLRCLWFLCKSLPQTFNRATEETRIHDICGLQ